jgi:hypothetical protein|tara:strand:- start:674 stop:934 length:261 start_codon:yes stop_codon:yes gene_type:complete
MNKRKNKKVYEKKPSRGPSKDSFSYEKKLSKRDGILSWLVIERPTGSIIASKTFEEDAQEVVDFQNKHKVWASSGGLVEYLTVGKL